MDDVHAGPLIMGYYVGLHTQLGFRMDDDAQPLHERCDTSTHPQEAHRSPLQDQTVKQSRCRPSGHSTQAQGAKASQQLTLVGSNQASATPDQRPILGSRHSEIQGFQHFILMAFVKRRNASLNRQAAFA